MRKCLLFGCCWLVSTIILAQQPGYLHFDLEDGLPANFVYCAEQDRDGYMWFGTEKGLSRFDGIYFKNYGIEDGLPDEEVLLLNADQVDRLWIVCYRQKNAYRYNGRFYTTNEDPRLSNIRFRQYFTDFCSRSDTAIWMSSGDMYQIDMQTLNVRRTIYLPNLYFQIRFVGDRWWGFGRNAIYSLDMSRDTAVQHEAYTFNKGFKFMCKSVTVRGNRALFALSNKALLLEMRGGEAVLLDEKAGSYEYVYTDRSGRFWACVPGKGVVCFNNQQGNLTNEIWYMPSKKVQHVFEDRQGNFWFLTAGEGIYQLPKSGVFCWGSSDGFLSENLRSVKANQQGKVWVGDDIGNIFVLKNGKISQKISTGAADGKNEVRKIIPENGNQYILVDDEGIFRSDGQRTEIITSGDSIGAAKTAVFSKQTGLWIGSSAKLLHIPPEGRIRQFSGRVTALAEDDEGIIWKGNTEGLFSSNQQFGLNWGERFPLLNSRIVTMQFGGDGLLLVISATYGLLYVNVRQGEVVGVSAYNQTATRPIKDIKSLTATPDGAIWLATSTGIYCVQDRTVVRSFTTRNGLPSNEINDLSIYNDTLWAATANGLVMARLSDFTRVDGHFQTKLTRFQYRIGDRVVTEDFTNRIGNDMSSIQIPTSARMAEASFSALNMLHPVDLKYEMLLYKSHLPFPWYTFNDILRLYRWDYSPDTIIQTSNIFSQGSDIPAGRYLIVTTAITIDGVRSERSVYWMLEVQPSLHETIWPWVLLIMGAVVASWLWYTMRIRNQRLRADAIQQRLTALRAQINPHFIGNSINALQQFFYPPDPVKASEYIHLFTVLLRKTLSLSEKDFIPLQEELLYIQEYLEMIQLRYEDRFVFNIDISDDIDTKQAFPAMLLQPVLENATLHGLAPQGISRLSIQFRTKNGRLFCAVQDNGIGINTSKARKTHEEAHASKGLAIINDKIDMLNRVYGTDIRIAVTDLSDTQEGIGTRVEISMQVSYDAHKRNHSG